MHKEKLNDMLKQFTQSCEDFGQKAVTFWKNTSSEVATFANQKWLGLKTFYQEKVQKSSSPVSEITPSADSASSSQN